MDQIIIRGARTHNLKNVTLELPRGRYIVFTGPSGSGKSSLAFDTLYAEGERRYVESLSPGARQFLERLPRPDVDEVSGVPPAVAIDQKSAGGGARSTVGTLTECVDYLRVLYARAGTPCCPTHGTPLAAEPVAAMTDRLLLEAADRRLLLLAPVFRGRVFEPGEAAAFVGEMLGRGYRRLLVDGVVETLEAAPEAAWLADGAPHDLAVVVDRLRVRSDSRERIAESLENAVELADGRAAAADMDSDWRAAFTSKFACPYCDWSAGPMEPRDFSPSNPRGACPACRGTGVREGFDPERLVVKPGASIETGALQGVRPGSERFEALLGEASGLGIDPSAPWETIGLEARRRLLQTLAANMEAGWCEAGADEQAAAAPFRALLPCPACGGTGLGVPAHTVRLGAEGPTFVELADAPVEGLPARLEAARLSGPCAEVARRLFEGLLPKLACLNALGLGYLTLGRRTDTLSGGERQRVRLAGQIGSGLAGVLYVLDEPSIGLHPRDGAKLIETIKRLRDQGNTVVVVEHDEAAVRAADWVVDMGPGAGETGGRVVAQGTPAEIEANPDSLTGAYLAHRRRVAAPPPAFDPAGARWLRLRGACGRTLKNVDFAVPVGALTVVTGVSGSGKSTLVADTLLPALARRLNRAEARALPYGALEGLEHFDRVVAVDQSPVGRTPRSNAATYTGLFTLIREVFAQTLTARERGYGAARFSFNARGGRCEACVGDGVVRLEMQFLPDVFVTCEVCGGRRYNRETLECRWKGLSIADVLDLSAEAAREVFSAQPMILRRLEALCDVGLGYLRLGQSAATFSGGEAQRVKLAAELAHRGDGRTIYILDEPTTGLHFDDEAKLLAALRRLTALGNTVLVIEHDPAVAAAADWVVDMGPGGGDAGGRIVAEGTPAEVARAPQSVTGPFIAPELEHLGGVQA